ncbi:MAG: cation:proton antiporter [Deltaproteobacteria bacterium]|nr:cation:proton antiporter [Deltaproteobacteria bacterium]
MNADSVHDVLVTMMVAISAGVFLTVLARWMRVPAILLLLLGGLALGRQGVALVHPESLGAGLTTLISLSVALILFEGGLSLDAAGFRHASVVIRRLLTVGVLVSWIGAALAVAVSLRVPLPVALLAGSLVIVTGPTAITPILRRIRIRSDLHNILHWESVLIDPVGVFVAILCFEGLLVGTGGTALTAFVLRFVTGLAMGALCGGVTWALLRVGFVPENLTNVFTLACAVLTFGLTEMVGYSLGFSEAGLLSVVVAGLALGILQPPGLQKIREYCDEIASLLIAILFILLTARLDFAHFLEFGVPGALAVALVVFVVRPVNILLSTRASGLGMREKVLLSWVAPRGIVAASMASLFALELETTGNADAALLETFTYGVIVATVVLQGLTAGPLARLLGLQRPTPRGWMIVGAHSLSRQVGRFLATQLKVPVVLVDMNSRQVAEARAEGLAAIHSDARNRSLRERAEVQEAGNLLALTDNESLNELLCTLWRSDFRRDHRYFWRSGGQPEAAHHAGGAPIWSTLPRPTVVAAELLSGQATLAEGDEPPPGQAGVAVALVSVRGPSALFPSADAERPGPKVPTLFLVRKAEYLLRGLDPSLVLRVEETGIEGLMGRVAGGMAAIREGLSGDALAAELIEQTRRAPAVLGQGVAVPHAHSPTLRERVCAVVRLGKGLDLGAPDAEPVRLLFALASPSDDPEGHLATLAAIARVVADGPTRRALLDAHAPEDVIRLIREFKPLDGRRR